MRLQSTCPKAKPFLKWAGGKTQLLPIIERMLPASFDAKKSITYIEPFVGGGALLFYLLENYPNIQKAIICDINSHLINAYRAIKHYPEKLIHELYRIQSLYKALGDFHSQKHYFLSVRELFNNANLSLVEDAAYLIFLNRTCFNGLYRENSKGKFNVSFGKYTNPTILDENTIRADSKILQKVEILQGDFSQIENHISGYSFIYFDPPYKPITSSSGFTAYNKNNFNDSEQLRLKEFYDRMSGVCHILLSNSDCASADPYDSYIDNLYKDFIIERVLAKRSISCSGSKRGPISELLIRNYHTCKFHPV